MKSTTSRSRLVKYPVGRDEGYHHTRHGRSAKGRGRQDRRRRGRAESSTRVKLNGRATCRRCWRTSQCESGGGVRGLRSRSRGQTLAEWDGQEWGDRRVHTRNAGLT